MKQLPKVIEVNEDNCVNCHACITACPVKFCNNGKGDHVTVNQDLCIACGSCLDACTHDARLYIDDFDNFMNDIQKGEKIVAISAPSVAANFPGTYLQLNGWLASLGVEAIFDVSFGAELTVKSYVEHIKNNNPSTCIASPCSAIVTYITLYQPKLTEHLVPYDSPMLHVIRMLQKYYPQYKEHKVVILSPCTAKKREFELVGIGDYNIGFASIDKYLEKNKINLTDFPKKDFDNPAAERAVLFSSPGGLLETAERWLPGISKKSRKIEGVHSIYPYLDKLPKMIKEQKAPLIIDCLNCENGCNAGPLTLNKEKSIDEVEYWINKRNNEMQEKYKDEARETNVKFIEDTINAYWTPDLYKRKIESIDENNTIKTPSITEITEIYQTMHKFKDEDIYNCSACGYGTCEDMAKAIYNDLNRPENCHFYLSTETENSHKEITKSQKRFSKILSTTVEGFIRNDTQEIIVDVNDSMREILGHKNPIGMSLYDFLDEENKKILQEQNKLRKENQRAVYKITFTKSNGEKIPCQISGTPLCNEMNEEIGSFAMVSDISDLIKSQQKLEKLNKELDLKVQQRTGKLNNTLEEVRAINEQLEMKQVEIDENIEELKVTNEVMESINTELEQNEKALSSKNNELILQKAEIIEKNEELEQQKEEILAINESLKDKQDEIIKQRDAVTQQRDQIHKQSKKIQFSIEYASRIQNALLKSEKELSVQDYFVFFKPKDIVSGDFYWFKKFFNFTVIVAADSTGHGVPGAFMSLLGISLLNEITYKHYRKIRRTGFTASKILDDLRNNIIKLLGQNFSKDSTKDGIDLAICILDNDTNELQYAGAYNPLFLIQNNEMQHIKGDKMPAGIHFKDMKNKKFINHSFQLQKDNIFYIFSDGYHDQFGGEKGRKLHKRNFKDILLKIYKKPMNEQKNILTETIEQYMGNYKQTDDMLVVGIKI